MMTVITKLKVQAGKEAQFERGAREMIAYVKAHEPGTLTYLVHRAVADPTLFCFYEIYADEAAFTTHGSSDRMREFGKSLGGLLDGRPEITMFTEIDGKR